MSRGFTHYVAKRLGFAGLMLVGVSVILFTLMRLAPGGPEAVLVGGEFSQEVAAQVRERLGLDRPLLAQYGSWVLAALRGDLGRSFKTGDPVLTLVLDRLLPTLQLTGGALALALLVAVPMGVLAAVRRDTVWDTVASAIPGVARRLRSSDRPGGLGPSSIGDPVPPTSPAAPPSGWPPPLIVTFDRLTGAPELDAPDDRLRADAQPPGQIPAG